MRITRLVTLAGIALLVLPGWFTTVPAFGQSGGSSTQAGYAIVTTVFGSVSTLRVVETFGLSDGSTSAQASAASSTLTTQVALLVSIDPSFQRDTGVAIANPGLGNANITLRLDDSGGRTVATRSIPVPAARQIARFVTEMFSGTPDLNQTFNGTLLLTSDAPVAITALRFRGTSFGNLPLDIRVASPNPLPLLLGGSVGGPSAVLLSHFVAGGGWASQIALSNSGAFQMIVRIDLFDQNGNPLTVALNGQSGSSFTNVQIPAGGIVVLSTPPGLGGVPAF